MFDWDRTTFDADGLEGELLRGTADGDLVGTVVVWPGFTTRVVWRGGEVTTFPVRNSRSAAIQAVEERGIAT